jgi:hypothetical protein
MTDRMNAESELSELLHGLPPALPELGDRFERVAARVRRRRRLAAMSATALAVAVVVAVPVALHGLPGHGRAMNSPVTEPTSPPEVPTPTPTALHTASASDQVLPGGTRTIELGDPMTFTETGTASVQLTTPPEGATALTSSLACLDPGRLVWPDGSSMTCGAGDVVKPDADPRDTGYNVLDLVPGQTTFTVKAPSGMGWKLSATYVRTEQTPWGINAQGQTYGVENRNGTPDLLAVQATNGRQGYAYATEVNGPQPTSPADALAQNQAYPNGRDIPVYESDGVSRIGTFHVEPGIGYGVSGDPFPTLLLIVNHTPDVVVLTTAKDTTIEIKPGRSVRLASERACALIPLQATTADGKAIDEYSEPCHGQTWDITGR